MKGFEREVEQILANHQTERLGIEKYAETTYEQMIKTKKAGF